MLAGRDPFMIASTVEVDIPVLCAMMRVDRPCSIAACLIMSCLMVSVYFCFIPCGDGGRE